MERCITQYNQSFNEIYHACKLIQKVAKQDHRIHCSHIFIKDNYIYATDSKVLFKINNVETIETGVYKIIKVIKKHIILDLTDHKIADTMPDVEQVLNSEGLTKLNILIDTGLDISHNIIDVYRDYKKTISSYYMDIVAKSFDDGWIDMFSNQYDKNKPYSQTPVLFKTSRLTMALMPMIRN